MAQTPIYRHEPSTSLANVHCLRRWVKTDLYCICREHKAKTELFRVLIGDRRPWYWTSGIDEVADLNGDGKPDFTFEAGDDTSSEFLVFLSSKDGYRAIDLGKTINLAARKRFHRKVNVDEVGATQFTNTTWFRRGERMFFTVQLSEIGEKGERTITVHESEFMFKPQLPSSNNIRRSR